MEIVSLQVPRGLTGCIFMYRYISSVFKETSSHAIHLLLFTPVRELGAENHRRAAAREVTYSS